MPKKRKTGRGSFVAPSEYADDYLADEWAETDSPLQLFEEDIYHVCSPIYARKGLALFNGGAVSERAFDGQAIRARVQDGNGAVVARYDLEGLDCDCPCPAMRRDGGEGCEHVAALMYAWLKEPQSFMPQNVGGLMQRLTQNPYLNAAGNNLQQVKAMAAAWQSAPPSVRESFARLPLDAIPEQVAQFESQWSALAEKEAERELSDLLERMTLEQRRGIAKRRGWTLHATAKTKAIAELVAHLRAAPMPTEFSPEEEQLIRIENTLWGVEHMPTHHGVTQDWRQRGGGNQARLEQALEGLRNAGLLFPCMGENAGLHYHWSPFLTAAMLPLLKPTVAAYPTQQVSSLRIVASDLPVLTWTDAVLAFTEREPLHLRLVLQDPQRAQLPFIGTWPYDPKEVESLQKTRTLRWGTAATLTVPYEPSFADDTLDALAALTGAPREFGHWIAALLNSAGLLTQTASAQATLKVERANAWRATSSEQQYQTLWKLWREGAATFSDFRMALASQSLVVRRATMDPTFTLQTLVEEMGCARQFVARMLATLAPQTWYRWPSLVEYAHQLRRDFLHTFTNDEMWWIADAHTAQKYSAHNTQQWNSAYRALLETMLTGALRWLGVVELGYENQQLAAFQITPLGAWLLSEGRDGYALVPSADDDGEPFTWVDETTFRVHATTNALRALAPLRVYAEPTREPLTFRLMSSAIARALQQGTSAEQIAQTFANVGLPLAHNAHARITTLAENAGRVNLYERLTVLELADDFALRELLATTTLRQHIVHQFSPRLVVVRDEAVDELFAELVKKGHTPLVTAT